jgi:IclR family pca regulon transcriptional regulator
LLFHGEAILAHLPEPDLEEALRQIRFDRKTKGTITSIEALKRELEEIRRKGYADNNEELEKGLVRHRRALAQSRGDGRRGA